MACWWWAFYFGAWPGDHRFIVCESTVDCRGFWCVTGPNWIVILILSLYFLHLAPAFLGRYLPAVPGQMCCGFWEIWNWIRQRVYLTFSFLISASSWDWASNTGWRQESFFLWGIGNAWWVLTIFLDFFLFSSGFIQSCPRRRGTHKLVTTPAVIEYFFYSISFV